MSYLSKKDQGFMSGMECRKTGVEMSTENNFLSSSFKLSADTTLIALRYDKIKLEN